mgnify:CR=1 FL=1
MRLNVVGSLGKRLRNVEAPVLVQEMRVRQRGIRPFAVMLAYLLILSVVGVLILYYNYPSDPTASNMADLGRQLYAGLAMAQLAMVCLIVPAYSSASVSSERERGTFDLLSLTLLSSSAIVTQKLVAAMGQALMLIFASLPIMAIVFFLGGVSPMELVLAYALILVTAIFLGSLGMVCSCSVKSSKTSTFIAYLIMFCLFLGLPLGSLWLQSISRQNLFAYDAIPLWATMLIFIFVGGVGAVLAYAPLSLLLSRKPIWRVRAFRMSIFGAVYALLLLLVTCPRAADIVLNANGTGNVPVALYINPFAALALYMESWWGGLSAASNAYVMIAVTAAFSIGCALIFRYASSARLAGLRSS